MPSSSKAISATGSYNRSRCPYRRVYFSVPALDHSHLFHHALTRASSPPLLARRVQARINSASLPRTFARWKAISANHGSIFCSSVPWLSALAKAFSPGRASPDSSKIRPYNSQLSASARPDREDSSLIPSSGDVRDASDAVCTGCRSKCKCRSRGNVAQRNG